MVRARLLTYEEAFLLGCREAANSCPSYLYTNLRNTGDSNTAGYWLSTSHSIYDYAAWSVYLRGNLDNHVNSRVTDSSSAGVRPVITLEK